MLKLITFLLNFSRFVNELNERFSEKNQKIFRVFEIFDHSSPDFFNLKCSYLHSFISHYNYFEINTSKILTEFPSTKSLLQNNKMIQLNFDSIVSSSLSQLPAAFSETSKIISILKTLPISTATNERFFSSLKNVKTFLRTTMGDDRLSDIMVLNVEKEEANCIDLYKAVYSIPNETKLRRRPDFVGRRSGSTYFTPHYINHLFDCSSTGGGVRSTPTVCVYRAAT